MFVMVVDYMQYLSDKLLNGLNPEQQSAVKTTDGTVTNGWSRKWEDKSAYPSNWLFNC